MYKKIKSQTVKIIKNYFSTPMSRKLSVEDPVKTIIKASELASLDEISLAFIDFDNSDKKVWKISDKLFSKCIFSQKIIANIDFQNCTFKGCAFNNALFLEVEFHNCNFYECHFYKAKFKETYIDPDCLHFSSKWKWHRANVNSGLFQSLYHNSKSMHQENFAMRADRSFQFYRRYQLLYEENPNFKGFLQSLLFDYLLGSGYGIKNSLIITILGILGFAWLLEDKIKPESNNFLEAVYFTVVSLTTAGYGDFSPTHKMLPMLITTCLLLSSVAWCAVVTAIIVKRIVK